MQGYNTITAADLRLAESTFVTSTGRRDANRLRNEMALDGAGAAYDEIESYQSMNHLHYDVVERTAGSSHAAVRAISEPENYNRLVGAQQYQSDGVDDGGPSDIVASGEEVPPLPPKPTGAGISRGLKQGKPQYLGFSADDNTIEC